MFYVCIFVLVALALQPEGKRQKVLILEPSYDPKYPKLTQNYLKDVTFMLNQGKFKNVLRIDHDS